VKIAIVGLGNVGATTAYALLLSGLAADIVLIDVNEKKAQGEAMDLNHAVPFSHPTKIWAGDYPDCEGAAIVIIAAGINQKPGQSRMDLLKLNFGIFKSIIPEIVRYASDSILLIATNPVDVLTYASWKLSGFPTNRVIGSGTALDTARFRYLLGQYYEVDPQSVHADIIGEHGETELPVWSLASIAGMRLEDYCREAGKDFDSKGMLLCFHTTKNAARDIIQLKGMTDYGVAAALVRIVETILRDENTLLTVSTVGPHAGVDDVCLSIPTKVNRGGANHVLKVMLNSEEQKALLKSAESVKAAMDTLNFG
jgi:L-lactate dehydrogenase